MDSTTRIIERVVGTILLVLCVGIVGLSVLAAKMRLEPALGFDRSTILTILAMFGLGCWLGSIGYRLVANKPNRHGSLLAPAGWYVLSIALFMATAVAVVVAAWKKDATLLGATPFAALMAWWCWIAATNAREKRGGESSSDWMSPVEDSRKGYFRVLSIRGVPIFIHQSLPMGGLLFAMYAGFDTGNVLYYCLGYLSLVGLHEAAHAIAAKAVGLKVMSIDISGVGGVCNVEVPKQTWHAAIVYSAGILIQLVLLVATLSYVLIAGKPTTPFGESMVATFTIANAIVLFLNILPTKISGGIATDGAVLWQLFQHAYRRQPYPFAKYVAVPADQSPVFAPDTRLLSIPNLAPEGFKHGVEILNDKSTPMEFVVACLMRHLDLSHRDAVATMIAIHNNGGILLPLPSMARAEEIAAAIAADASQGGHLFVCRPVDATRDS